MATMTTTRTRLLIECPDTCHLGDMIRDGLDCGIDRHAITENVTMAAIEAIGNAAYVAAHIEGKDVRDCSMARRNAMSKAKKILSS